jgi:tetratricopeptide (TPR) repeat protein
MKTSSGIALLIFFVVTTNLQAEPPFCGELDVGGQFGPFDYADSYDRKEHLPVVEGSHFTSDVKNLIQGSTGSIGGDIGYTLRAFPNHYPALNALAKLHLRDKNVDYPRDQVYSVECYFDRAMRFKPSDVMVRTIYGNYLQRLGGRQDDALEQYQVAVRLQPENATVNYNLGLIYLKEKDYEQAIVHAKKAYELGFPLPGLRNKLMKTGKWDGKLDEEVRDEVAGNIGEKIDIEP